MLIIEIAAGIVIGWVTIRGVQRFNRWNRKSKREWQALERYYSSCQNCGKQMQDHPKYMGHRFCEVPQLPEWAKDLGVEDKPLVWCKQCENWEWDLGQVKASCAPWRWLKSQFVVLDDETPEKLERVRKIAELRKELDEHHATGGCKPDTSMGPGGVLRGLQFVKELSDLRKEYEATKED